MVDLKKMTNVLEHRGPDDFGYEIFDSSDAVVGLGHRRLSILDLSPQGHQPFFSTDNRYCIVYNGEIYNYQEIKLLLENLNYSFRSTSDTEVLLNAFIEWGVDSVNKFTGMFAFTIYDTICKKVYLFRDRAGVKPLYYYYKKGLFLFSSELKSFHENNSFEKAINQQALYAFFMYGYIPAPNCIFLNAYKLLPGHYMIIDLSVQSIAIHQYWNVYDYYSKPKFDLSEIEAIKQTESILSSAFNYRMISDVPVGVFLSGGFDSTAVTALLQKNSAKRIKTFTIGFEDERYNEAHNAKEISDILNTEHIEYYCTQKDALNIIPQLPVFFDEPFSDSSAIPTILLSKVVSNEVSVALSADAGDEIFGGYPKYQRSNYLFSRLTLAPKLLKNLCSARGTKYSAGFFYDQKILYKSLVKFEKITNYLPATNPANLMGIMSQSSSKREISKLLLSDYTHSNSSFDDFNSIPEIKDCLDKMLAIDYKTYLVDDIMVKVDRATMSASLEGREPLLDNRIIQFVAQLPSNLKFQGGTTKHLLKEIVYKYVPKEIIDRPKKGFSIPLIYWLSNELKSFIYKYLDNNRIEQEGLLNPDTVAAIRNAYINGNVYLWELVWKIITFEMWYEKWMK